MKSLLLSSFLCFSLSLNAKDIFSDPQKYLFRYEVSIPPVEKDFRVWIPYPVQDSVQKILKFTSSSSLPLKLNKETKYGNQMIFISGKGTEKKIKLLFQYEVLRYPDKGSKKKPDTYHSLKSDSLIPFSPQIRKISEKQAKKFTKPSQKIKTLYKYIVKTMTYDKSGTGWGKGDAVWACSTKRGNCTDFHSLFIALNRIQNIPATFEIGFPIPQEQTSGFVPGYHCWAKAYASDKGWIPVDTSEAKKTGKIDAYFGILPSNRIHFSSGRDIVLNPPQKEKPLNYFIYPYMEVQGKSFSNLESTFYFRKISS